MRNMFVVFAKLFALFLFLTLLLSGTFTLTQTIVAVVQNLRAATLWTAAWPVAIIAVEIGFIWLLLFRTAWVADRLGVVDDEISMSINGDTLLYLGIQLIGLYILITALPALVGNLVQMVDLKFKLAAGMDLSRISMNQQLIMRGLVTAVLKSILALVLLLKTSHVTRLISREKSLVTVSGSKGA